MAQVTSLRQGFKKQSDQPKSEYREWVDQWGRRWEGTVDLKSGDFCGLPPKPKGWTAPFHEWIPPATMFRCGRLYGVTKNGATRVLATEEMWIDLEPWKQQTMMQNRDWQQTLFDLVRSMSGDAGDPNKPTPEVLARIGPKPLPVEVIIAMEQGNRYVLGLTETVDERLRPYMPVRWIAAPLDFRDDFAEPALDDAAPNTVKRAKSTPRASQE
jgi:hypothetical protein